MKALIPLAFCLFLAGTVQATTFDGRFVVMTNNGTTYSVKVQIKADVAAGLGGASLAFTFNTSNLSFPGAPSSGVDYTFHSYTGGLYTAGVTRPLANKVSLNIEYNGGAGSATNVATSYTDVATITFTTTNAAGNSNLTWVTTQAIADDGFTPWTAGSFVNENTNPLPVQLTAFTAAFTQQQGGVVLKWTTASETNNYGFDVEKAQDSASNFQTIENSFIKGHGTTIEQHSYTFTDAGSQPGIWYYRLKQTDMDGTVHYSDAILPNGVTGVSDRPLPTVFALDQNYPNPFNPSTTIEFQLPKESRVTLEVYNLIGQRVATLVDEIRAAGYYVQRFDGAHLGSGVYFYRFSTPEVSFVRKMLLTK